ncbi:MAG: hypothetical protein ABSG26_03995 [Bryobacteraceae bacterium]|jgi:hypothetical protein
MNYFKRFLANASSSPKTTAAGLAGIIGSLTAALHNTALLSTAQWWTVLLVSGGLLFSADSKA